MTDLPELTQDYVREFVLPSHGDFEKVKIMLAADPRLLNTNYEAWDETPLGAASHVGNVEIAEFLLSKGAAMTICTAAMLGDKVTVEKFINDDPSLVNAKGAHGITLMFHVALSGNLEIAELLVERGGGKEGISAALVAATQKNHPKMVQWLLECGADVTVTNLQGLTPLQLAEQAGNQDITDLLRAAS